MTSDNSDLQLHLEEKSQLELEQIILAIKEIGTAISEINRRLDNFDNRLIILEQQQQQLTTASTLSNKTSPILIEKIDPDIQVNKITKEENDRSTCFQCTSRCKRCTLYFDDLYNFDTKEINTSIGADAARFRCSCGHIIRFHERNPNSLETKLPPFANPPIGQLLYEEVLPPIVQDWIWSFKKNKYNNLNQSNELNKED